MIRDPFYQDITTRLNGRLDPEIFERCATDLLRKIYPSLVPIRGGNDAGMDGAIADTDGTAFPLICTTGKDVIGNLTGSIRSYLQDGGQRRNAVLSTSQPLTQTRRRNLEKRAEELGFVLNQIHDQAAMADLLYRSPEWCRELLDLTGEPPALSALPLTTRPLIGETLIGRETDLAWLHKTPGDLLLVGQPGAGKTFLLRTLAKEGNALFVVSDDRGLIATGLRSQQPATLIVDDAHLRQELIANLRQLRSELQLNFQIIATCWPGARGEVAQTLNIPGGSVSQLDLLTRDQIVKVINATGIGGPTRLIRELVDQAGGKPGLAVTLSQLCLNGGIKEVALGDALSRDIKKTFEPLLGNEATTILAAFAVGGNHGMPIEVVASGLGITPMHVQRVAAGLATGGILHEVDQTRLSVHPRTLRYSLVRDIFFSGAASLPINGLLNRVPDLTDATLTLIGARSRGGSIPEGLLKNLVRKSHSDKIWSAYAGLGKTECSWVLENHLEKLSMVAFPALHYIPEKSIPLLLDAAIKEPPGYQSTSSHPLHILHEWVTSEEPHSENAIMNRGTLLGATLAWFGNNTSSRVALTAFQFVLSPAFSDTESDPGSGNQFSIKRAYLTLEQLKILQSFWPCIAKSLREHQIEDWSPIQEIVHTWAHPYLSSVEVPDQTYRFMRSFAAEILKDVADIAGDHPGILRWIEQSASSLQIKIPVSIDPEFAILFPQDDIRNWRQKEKQLHAEAEELAQKWSPQSPKQIIARLMDYEAKADAANITWPRLGYFLCGKIAEQADAPLTWLEAFLDANAPGVLVQPFISRAANTEVANSIPMLNRCLSLPGLQRFTTAVILISPLLPEEYVDQVTTDMDDSFSEMIYSICRNGRVPEGRLQMLLSHRDHSVAGAAALGEWLAEPKGIISEEFREIWRHAIVKYPGKEYGLEDIFESDSTVAYDWLEERIHEHSDTLWRKDQLVLAAISSLDFEQRRLLLNNLPADFGMNSIVCSLVGDDIGLFQILLDIRHLQHHHLAPLAGETLNGTWVNKALLALDSGRSPEDIVSAIFENGWGWSGNESDMWAEWIVRFGRLLQHTDSRIQQIARFGLEMTEHRQDRALKKERNEAIFGYRD